MSFSRSLLSAAHFCDYCQKENGDNTTLHIKNTTDKVAQALAGLNFPGGTYSLGAIELQPYQTIAINVGKIKTSQTPDPVGHVIPADAVSGQFVWWQETPYTMLGRSEHENVKAGTASSFSCFGSGCCTNFADYYSGGAFPMQGAAGTTDYFTVWREWYDCGGNYWNYTTFPNAGYYSDNTNVAGVSEVSVGQYNPTAEDTVRFNNAGTTNIHAYYATKYYTGYDGGYNSCHGPFLNPAQDFGAQATTCDFILGPMTAFATSCNALTANQVTFSGNPTPSSCPIIPSQSQCLWQQSGNVHVESVNQNFSGATGLCTVTYFAGPAAPGSNAGTITLQMTLGMPGGAVTHQVTANVKCPSS